MMKSLVREVPFGKLTARITVTMFTELTALLTERVITSSDVEIIVNGKVAESGSFARVLEFNNNTDTFYKRAKLDVTKKYTRVGDRALTEGEVAGVAINEAIKEMKEELSKQFDEETKESKQERLEIEEAKAIIEQAEKEGIDNLMNKQEIKQWRKRYNDLYNEGGEGYIPAKVSKESYSWALEILKNAEVV